MGLRVETIMGLAGEKDLPLRMAEARDLGAERTEPCGSENTGRRVSDSPDSPGTSVYRRLLIKRRLRVRKMQSADNREN